MERPAYIGCNSHARRGGAPPTVPRPPRRWGVARARSPRIPRVPPRRASTPARLPFRSTPARGCGVCTPPPPSADLFPSALQACARRWGAGWGGRAPGAGPADSARGGAGRGGGRGRRRRRLVVRCVRGGLSRVWRWPRVVVAGALLRRGFGYGATPQAAGRRIIVATIGGNGRVLRHRGFDRGPRRLPKVGVDHLVALV